MSSFPHNHWCIISILGWHKQCFRVDGGWNWEREIHLQTESALCGCTLLPPTPTRQTSLTSPENCTISVKWNDNVQATPTTYNTPKTPKDIQLNAMTMGITVWFTNSNLIYCIHHALIYCQMINISGIWMFTAGKRPFSSSSREQGK